MVRELIVATTAKQEKGPYTFVAQMVEMCRVVLEETREDVTEDDITSALEAHGDKVTPEAIVAVWEELRQQWSEADAMVKPRRRKRPSK
ncbi:MAG: hypothetical protein FWG15_07640 [Propionibacteriaceae bacterium]|nr:hypothetical protein [Propionibacteriaceae bacterium]